MIRRHAALACAILVVARASVSPGEVLAAAVEVCRVTPPGVSGEAAVRAWSPGAAAFGEMVFADSTATAVVQVLTSDETLLGRAIDCTAMRTATPEAILAAAAQGEAFELQTAPGTTVWESLAYPSVDLSDLEVCSGREALARYLLRGMGSGAGYEARLTTGFPASENQRLIAMVGASPEFFRDTERAGAWFGEHLIEFQRRMLVVTITLP